MARSETDHRLGGAPALGKAREMERQHFVSTFNACCQVNLLAVARGNRDGVFRAFAIASWGCRAIAVLVRGGATLFRMRSDFTVCESSIRLSILLATVRFLLTACLPEIFMHCVWRYRSPSLKLFMGRRRAYWRTVSAFWQRYVSHSHQFIGAAEDSTIFCCGWLRLEQIDLPIHGDGKCKFLES